MFTNVLLSLNTTTWPAKFLTVMNKHEVCLLINTLRRSQPRDKHHVIETPRAAGKHAHKHLFFTCSVFGSRHPFTIWLFSPSELDCITFYHVTTFGSPRGAISSVLHLVTEHFLWAVDLRSVADLVTGLCRPWKGSVTVCADTSAARMTAAGPAGGSSLNR